MKRGLAQNTDHSALLPPPAKHRSYKTYRAYMDTRPPEILSNIAICLIHQANYLLDQQIRRLEKDFLKKGGLRENMTRARLDYRDQQKKRRP